jgi:hypothetical protein
VQEIRVSLGELGPHAIADKQSTKPSHSKKDLEKDFDKSHAAGLQSFIDILIIEQICQNANLIRYRPSPSKSCFLSPMATFTDTP